MRNKATRKNDEGLREKRCKTNDGDDVDPKEVSRERERERPRENFGFLLLSSYRRRYYYALKNEDYIYY